MLIFYLGVLASNFTMGLVYDVPLIYSISHSVLSLSQVPLWGAPVGSRGWEVPSDPRGSRRGWELENRDLELWKGTQSCDIASEPLTEEGGLTEISPPFSFCGWGKPSKGSG